MADASTFYVFGICHTVLRLGFNITFAEFVPLTDWIADVLDGQIVHLGP